jgi:heme/copper-type cytochrome/quinol oxidase subunit 4
MFLLIPETAHAYIDPGSGSAIMSAIIGFFVVIGLTIKSFWYKISSIFTGGSKDESQDL